MPQTALTSDSFQLHRLSFFWIDQAGKLGVECTACGDRFFDQKSEEGQLLVSCIDKAIGHARRDHQSEVSVRPVLVMSTGPKVGPQE